jgi:hypothetical protein
VAEKAHAGTDKNKTALRKIDNFIPKEMAVQISSNDGALARASFQLRNVLGKSTSEAFSLERAE